MGEELSREYFESALQCALQALALPSDEQFAYHAGVCPACELDADFYYPYEVFARRFGRELSTDALGALARVEELLELIRGRDDACWSRETLDRQSWCELRVAAVDALRSLGWPVAAPPGFQETSPGVYVRVFSSPDGSTLGTTTIVRGGE